MNERIRELAEQADEYTDTKLQTPGEYHPDWHDVRDQKFAALIVKECMGILNTRKDYPVIVNSIKEIKEYFGVE